MSTAVVLTPATCWSEGTRIVRTDHLVWFCGWRECSSAGRLENVAHPQNLLYLD